MVLKKQDMIKTRYYHHHLAVVYFYILYLES